MPDRGPHARWAAGLRGRGIGATGANRKSVGNGPPRAGGMNPKTQWSDKDMQHWVRSVPPALEIRMALPKSFATGSLQPGAGTGGCQARPVSMLLEGECGYEG